MVLLMQRCQSSHVLGKRDACSVCILSSLHFHTDIVQLAHTLSHVQALGSSPLYAQLSAGALEANSSTIDNLACPANATSTLPSLSDCFLINTYVRQARCCAGQVHACVLLRLQFRTQHCIGQETRVLGLFI